MVYNETVMLSQTFAHIGQPLIAAASNGVAALVP